MSQGASDLGGVTTAVCTRWYTLQVQCTRHVASICHTPPQHKSHIVQALAALKKQYGFLLLVDDAHGTLVLGPRGGGVADAAGLCDAVDVHIGTLSKAFGAQGGFVACTHKVKKLMVNAGRAYMFSTALPVPVVAAAIAALQVFRRC